MDHPGQEISLRNLTASYNVNTGVRTTYRVDITTRTQEGNTVVKVNVDGPAPASNIQVQLPIFADAGVQNVSGGTYDASTESVTMTSATTLITLGNAGRPAVNVQVASTVAGQHTQPALTAGTATTATATIKNTGSSELTNVSLTPSTPAGWSVQATSPVSFASIDPGATQTVTWSVTPPAGTSGSNGVVVSASYSAAGHRLVDQR